VNKATWCVYSGLAGHTIVYQKAIFVDGVFKTIRIEYPDSNKAAYDPLVKRLVASFHSIKEE
jgi:hypothetical protein